MARTTTDIRLFIISDLHLGGCADAAGRPGSRLFSAQAALADFIDWVCAQGTESEAVELVVNGDIVDFLADDPAEDGRLHARIFSGNETEAIATLEAIRHTNAAVFEALARFLAAGHRLTLLLGNHDVELSLPGVRRHLETCLDAQGRDLKFVYDGEAYTVGRVLIEHGNRYDPWNFIDHDALRRERSVRSRGEAGLATEQEHLRFVPPAGTLLVIHFLNRIKRHYRFVDLLKPEDEAVLPLLMALSEGEWWRRLDDIVTSTTVARRRMPWRLQRLVQTAKDRNLAGQTPDVPASLADLAQRLGLDKALFRVSSGRNLAGGGIWTPWQAVTNSIQMGALALGFADRNGEPFRRLHEALIRLNLTDDSFRLDQEKEQYLDPARELIDQREFQVVVFGHTHLPKQVPGRLDRGFRTCYINTGTWADVMRLPPAVLERNETGQTAVAQFCEALQANDHARYVQRYLAYAEILVRDGVTRQADLRFWCGAGRERETDLTGYPG